MGYDDDTPERARRALHTLHEAREQADQAVDAYIDAHYAHGPGADELQPIRVELHKAVIRFYNRMRPYLSAAELHERVVTGDDDRALRLSTLDEWRTPSVATDAEVERVGKANQTTREEIQIALPAGLAIAAYDELNEAFVAMQFGAEPGDDVPETDLDADDADAGEVEVVDGVEADTDEAEEATT